MRAQEAHSMNEDSVVVAQVRRQLGQDRTRSGQRVFSSEARRAAVTFTRARQRQGNSIAATARLLGLHPVLLGTWLRRAEPSFVPVTVQDRVAAETPAFSHATRSDVAPPMPLGGPVVVHLASGLRVEGLSVEQIAALLRSVR